MILLPALLLLVSQLTACSFRPDYSSHSVNVEAEVFNSEIVSQKLPSQHKVTVEVGRKHLKSTNLYEIEINGHKEKIRRKQEMKRIYFKHIDHRKYNTAHDGGNFWNASFKYVYFPIGYNIETLKDCHEGNCTMWYGQKYDEQEWIEFSTYSDSKYVNSKQFSIKDNGIHVFRTYSDGSQNKFKLNLEIASKSREETNPYVGFKRKEPTTLEQLDALAFEISNDHGLFSVERSVEKSALSISDLQIKSPSWAKTFFSGENGQIFLNVMLKAPGVSFEKNAEQLGITNNYRYLIKDFIEKKQLKVSLIDASQKETSLLLPYYDGSKIKAEIARIENLGYGYLRLTANQNDVDIFIDGRKEGVIGSQPFVAKLKEGGHTITAKKRFFGAKTVELNLDKDEAFAYEFILKTAGNFDEQVGKGKIVQKTGKLTLLSVRNDISVFIEGVERVPPVTLPNMAQGSYKIKIVAPEQTKYFEIVVGANKNNVVNIDELF